MQKPLDNGTMLLLNMHVHPQALAEFTAWLAKLNTLITASPGFISLEVLSPKEKGELWTVVQRFCDAESLSVWRSSKDYEELIAAVRELLADERLDAVQEKVVQAADLQGGVTEVFVTQISPDQEDAFRKWVAKIHQVEAQFPGFRGMYIQSPRQIKGQNWVTFLQFDTTENLDRWLSSQERQAILEESKGFISLLESHRVISPYAGWFSSLVSTEGLPPVWKQTCVVLLVLFPIVMLELKFLSPLTRSLNSSVATFIGNAISVALISWPFMPIAIGFLGWWLSPKQGKQRSVSLMGTLVILILYMCEILLFWNLL
ncbi:antibiotic biosynthesis monooxygenase [Candidatus Protochlamydia phocaeensis]|uniref:antibiotic biosynthesis monooxygenase n=1 Tax=Candidatus Protochlamydia phocaeensis TaxID=1414722 RepID=UPI001E490F28|nr:antibiotic biosynthesis monooxygenase [Candidatus Protochlamydia phocaeensis]